MFHTPTQTQLSIQYLYKVAVIRVNTLDKTEGEP